MPTIIQNGETSNIGGSKRSWAPQTSWQATSDSGLVAQEEK